MGQRITQTIYTCDACGKTPENGEHMWHMGSEVWCKDCCDNQNGKDDYPKHEHYRISGVGVFSDNFKQNKND